MSKSKTPRGIRNHNPGNIRWGDPWQGLIPKAKRTDTAFCQFESAAYGIRALARTLITYQDKYDLRTIRQIVTRWAPPVENNTAAYIHAVSNQTGFPPDQKLDMHEYAQLYGVVGAIIRHENGRGPISSFAHPNTWYDRETLDKGLVLAGVVSPVPVGLGNIPVTRETIGATAAGSAGVAQIADVLTSIPTGTLTQANEHLSSGSTVRLGIGIALVAVAAFIAWSQIKRHQAGTL